MKFHPIADIWPMMSDEEITQLSEDIKERGQLIPIYLYEGKILDGRNRWKACKEAGLVPKTTDYKGNEAVAFAWSLNEKRRHLNSAARAAMAVEILPRLEEEAEKKNGGRPKKGGEKIPHDRAPKSTERAASITGSNGRYVQDAKKVKEASPDIFNEMKAGRISMQDAKKAVNAKPTSPWSDSEKERRDLVKDGWTVVANAESDKNLVAWAEKKAMAVRIDRGSKWGNPFLLGKDGTRDQVCANYGKHYFPRKPSLQSSIEELRGKVLVCHCFPEKCHGDFLVTELH